MIIRSYYSKKESIVSNPGSCMKTEYMLSVDEKGYETLKVTGETDVQKMIDSYKDMVDLDIVLERLNNGDESALEQVEGFYADVTGIPNNLQDVMNLNLNGKMLFDSLPPEYRNIYGDNYQSFVLDPAKLGEYINAKEYGNDDNENEEVTVDDN